MTFIAPASFIQIPGRKENHSSGYALTNPNPNPCSTAIKNQTMLSLHLWLVQTNNLPLSSPSPSPIFSTKKRKSFPSSSSSSWIIEAVDKDSQQFEVNPEKAKEALQKLDQELQILSKKQVATPKIKASDVKLARDGGAEEEIPVISGSFLSILTVILLIFTIFYNTLFYAVIKPAVDGRDEIDPQSTSQTLQ